MAIALAVLTFVCLFLLVGLFHVYNALNEANAQISVLAERDEAWGVYADNLEERLATIHIEYGQLLSIYKAVGTTAKQNTAKAEQSKAKLYKQISQLKQKAQQSKNNGNNHQKQHNKHSEGNKAKATS